MAIVFFWIGAVTTALGTMWSLLNDGDDKRGVVIFPFLMFVAAIAAKYLGL